MVRKKIYFLINSLEGGGAERVITNMAEKFSRDMDVTIFTLKDVNFYTLPEHVQYKALSSVQNNICMIFMIPWYVYHFRSLLKNTDFSGGVSFLEIANFVHILSKKDAIISFRTNISLFTGLVGRLYIAGIRWLYPRARQIIVNSEENRFDLARYLHISLEKIVTVYNPIDEVKIHTQVEWQISEEIRVRLQGKKVFITTGRLVWFKHHAKIIDSLRRVYDTVDTDWIYLILWDRPERQKLEKMTKEFWLTEHIIFLGAQKNVFPYLKNADYFLYASQVEWFPNVLIEAMAWNTVLSLSMRWNTKSVISRKCQWTSPIPMIPSQKDSTSEESGESSRRWFGRSFLVRGSNWLFYEMAIMALNIISYYRNYEYENYFSQRCKKFIWKFFRFGTTRASNDNKTESSCGDIFLYARCWIYDPGKWVF